MEIILQEIKEKQHAEGICKIYSLNFKLLSNFFRLKAKGLNNVETSGKLGVHRVTVQRYTHALKSMKESEFSFLYNHVLGDVKNARKG